MFTAWVLFHVIVSLGLVIVVLLQSSKGEGLAGSAFGGAGLSGAVFGGRGAASFLAKATTVLAVLFMVNCVALAFMSSSNRTGVATATPETDESVVTRMAQEERERAMQQQQQQQQMADTAANVEVNLDSLMNLQQQQETPTDTGGQ